MNNPKKMAKPLRALGLIYHAVDKIHAMPSE